METGHNRLESMHFKPELWQGQEEALEALDEAHAQDIQRGYIHMATGTGKTRVAAEDAKRHIEKTGGKILYLCHNSEILRQAREQFSEVLGKDTKHGNMFGGEFEDQEDIVYATFQTMTRGLGGGKVYEGFDPEEFDYVVVDETHHAPAETYQEVVKYFQPDFMLGLTATPNRQDGKSIEELVGPELFSLPLERAIAEGYVTPVDYRILTDNVKQLSDLKAEGKKLDVKNLDKQLFIPKSDEEIVESIQTELADVENPRTVVFCSNIQTAELFSEMYPADSVTIHSDMSPEEVKERIAQFRSGEISMAVTVNMFNEGIDLPEINSVVFLRPTESETIWLQGLGRGLRKAVGKEKVVVLDYVASFSRISAITELKNRVHSYRSKDTKKRRENETFLPVQKHTSFTFNFSEEAQRCLEIIQVAKNRMKPKPKKVKQQDSPEIQDIKKRFGITDRKRITDDGLWDLSNEGWEGIVAQVRKGDKELQAKVLQHYYPTILGLAKLYPEQNGLTVEDYFMAGCEGYLRGMLISVPEAESMTLTNSFNTEGRKAINKLIKETAVLKDGVAIGKGASAAAKYYTDSIDRTEYTHEIAGDIEVESLNDAHTTMAPEEFAVEALTKNKITRLMSRLSPDEKHVLAERYGLAGGESRTAEAVARGSGMTAARVREIENNALKRLAQDPEAVSLRDSWGDSTGVLYREENWVGRSIARVHRERIKEENRIMRTAVNKMARRSPYRRDFFRIPTSGLEIVVYGMIQDNPELLDSVEAIQREVAFQLPYGIRLKDEVEHILPKVRRKLNR